MTDLLSQKTFAGPSIGIPNVHNLYLIASNISTIICIAMNSEPKVEDSTVDWALENQVMGAQLRKIIIPVCEHLVTLSPAWSASTNALI